MEELLKFMQLVVTSLSDVMSHCSSLRMQINSYKFLFQIPAAASVKVSHTETSDKVNQDDHPYSSDGVKESQLCYLLHYHNA